MRFVIVCFVFLALAFYQLSGGANFVPRSIERQALADTVEAETPKPAARSVKPSGKVAGKVAVTAAAKTREEPVLLPTASRIDADTSAVVAASVFIRPDTTLETPEITLVSLGENPALFAAPETQPTTTATAASATPQAVEPQPAPTNIRRVNGNRVNLRSGPGTTFSVLTSLVRDTEVEVLADSGDGWLQLRAVDGGPTGWMADYLLTN